MAGTKFNRHSVAESSCSLTDQRRYRAESALYRGIDNVRVPLRNMECEDRRDDPKSISVAMKSLHWHRQRAGDLSGTIVASVTTSPLAGNHLATAGQVGDGLPAIVSMLSQNGACERKTSSGIDGNSEDSAVRPLPESILARSTRRLQPPRARTRREFAGTGNRRDWARTCDSSIRG